MSVRVRAGRLHRLHRGVYAVGHPRPAREGIWLAAILACGRVPKGGNEGLKTALDHWGAALSHRSAACLWQLLPRRIGDAVDVSVPGNGGKKRRSGVRTHRSLTLLPADVTLRDGIPVTTPARTLADLRRVASGPRRIVTPRELRRAIREAEVLDLPLDPRRLKVRERSDLELVFRRLCRRHRLPEPEVNVPIEGDLVDFLWRDARVVVETDGYIYHRGRQAFLDDRARDLRLRRLGYDVIRLSDEQVAGDAGRVVETLAAALRVGADGEREASEAG